MLAAVQTKEEAFIKIKSPVQRFDEQKEVCILQFLILKIETKLQNEIVKNVELHMQINKELQTATMPNRIKQVRTRIGYCEERINELFYGVYGLKEEEWKVLKNKIIY